MNDESTLGRPDPDTTATAPLLEVRDVVKEFPSRHRGPSLKAVAGVSFDVRAGETFGLVGESGCGKSTTLRCAVGLLTPTSGSVTFEGEDLATLTARQMRDRRRRFQTVFQDPQASLNPRMRVGDIIAEPLVVHGVDKAELHDRAREAADLVQLPHDAFERFPHEFSGGQRQRIGIARALVLDPALIALDEPVSALDVSIQAEILALLERLRDRLGLSYLMVAHDLSVVRHISDRVAVMYLGKIVEIGTVESLYAAPMHPYTQALFSAAPIPDPRIERSRRRIVLHGEIPDPTEPPSGCRFRTRCPLATEICSVEEPALVPDRDGHQVACHYAGAVDVVGGSSLLSTASNGAS